MFFKEKKKKIEEEEKQNFLTQYFHFKQHQQSHRMCTLKFLNIRIAIFFLSFLILNRTHQKKNII